MGRHPPAVPPDPSRQPPTKNVSHFSWGPVEGNFVTFCCGLIILLWPEEYGVKHREVSLKNPLSVEKGILFSGIMD